MYTRALVTKTTEAPRYPKPDLGECRGVATARYAGAGEKRATRPSDRRENREARSPMWQKDRGLHATTHPATQQTPII